MLVIGLFAFIFSIINIIILVMNKTDYGSALGDQMFNSMQRVAIVTFVIGVAGITLSFAIKKKG